MLMIGPPGSGKPPLARALPGILPEMSIDESLDVTRIYSVADQLPPETPLLRNRPFRSPHHTILLRVSPNWRRVTLPCRWMRPEDVCCMMDLWLAFWPEPTG